MTWNLQVTYYSNDVETGVLLILVQPKDSEDQRRKVKISKWGKGIILFTLKFLIVRY